MLKLTHSLTAGCEIVGQDGAQFEDALRRLNALECKLAGQVSPKHHGLVHHLARVVIDG